MIICLKWREPVYLYSENFYSNQSITTWSWKQIAVQGMPDLGLTNEIKIQRHFLWTELSLRTLSKLICLFLSFFFNLSVSLLLHTIVLLLLNMIKTLLINYLWNICLSLAAEISSVSSHSVISLQVRLDKGIVEGRQTIQASNIFENVIDAFCMSVLVFDCFIGKLQH